MTNQKLKNVKKNHAKKPKRHIRKSLLVVLALIIIACFLAFKIPEYKLDSDLKDLGYSKDTIKVIKEEELQDTLLLHSYYSSYLEQSILDGTLEKQYLNLYTVVEDRELEAKDFLLYARLYDKGYEEDQLENLFSNLYFYEITPLLVFDYQWDENPYIDDCKENRSANSETSFSLTNSYYTLYKLTKEISDPSNVNTLVNSTYTLDETYVPSVAELDTQYSAEGISMQSEAANAFTSFATAGVETGHNFFATVGYVDYDTQDIAYQSLLLSMSEEEADQYGARCGHSEHQTGLAVNVANTYETDVEFKDSEVYQWMLENCVSYGFINRYPTSKSSITGVHDEVEHFRYLGKELAQKVTESNLTYDEYYCLYLSSWIDEASKPSESILEQIENYEE